ncbi:acyl carrier protein [Rhodobacter sp. JA431]|uniref:acyl carrier protein n=1 Tax=Rhodobacter sp. JA431 TaxID=570013 RepID=UPI000BCC93A9|nr:acyl carrier protein [Rhodobacter sp. JA431]SOC21190.1 acyl carrier protein [Rhodobacter sp. JA431]
MTDEIAAQIASMVAKRLDASKDTANNGDLINASIDFLDLDSLDHLEVIMEVEDAYEVELDEERVMACDTIAEIAALVREATSDVNR